MARIGIALSGGGHRAALFGLGVLLYLIDAGKNHEVTSIASVSGGSLTNGYLAQERAFHCLTPSDVPTRIRPFTLQISEKGTLWAGIGTQLYLFVTVIALAGLFLVWLRDWNWAVRLIAFLLGLGLWHKLLAGQRGRVCDRAFARTLFRRKGKSTLLREIETAIDHVFCATDLHSGEHLYFAGNFVYAYRFGLGDPADLPLSTAVQASAAFPGGFPPRVLKTAPHNFTGGKNKARTMVLTDGGVYDNMADEWAVGMGKRNPLVPPGKFKQVEELVMVNSSGGMKWHSVVRLGFPLLGELFALLAIVDTLYDNTTSPRRSSLVQQFDQAERTGSGLRGALITIDQTPYTAANYFAKHGEWPQRQTRAQAVLSVLSGHSETEWNAIAQRNRSVATTLRALKKQRSAQLLYQAYVVAMTNLHIILGYPLLPIPSLQRFEVLVS